MLFAIKYHPIEYGNLELIVIPYFGFYVSGFSTPDLLENVITLNHSLIYLKYAVHLFHKYSFYTHCSGHALNRAIDDDFIFLNMKSCSGILNN